MPARVVASREIAQLFSVLSHPHRVRIVMELRDRERDVKGLQDILQISHSAVSQHLSVMRSHRLVTERREGRHVFYRLCQPGMAPWLLEGLRLIQGDQQVTDQMRVAIEDARSLWGPEAAAAQRKAG